jgi:16S rRNA (cytidine1402-2'-O)-methyltransferase
MSAAQKGELHLIPVPLGSDDVQGSLPATSIAAAACLDYFIVENEKSARRFLKQLPHPMPLQALAVTKLEKNATSADFAALLAPVLGGRSAGLLSEAGCPAVADPGAGVVDLAHRQGVRVVPHIGPSALTLALMASGFNGQRFAFNGYLPVNAEECRARLAALERESRQRDCTQIFIETPYRNDAMLQHVLSACQGATRVCIASDLTLPTQSISSKTVADWKKAKIEIGKRPSVFLLYAR